MRVCLARLTLVCAWAGAWAGTAQAQQRVVANAGFEGNDPGGPGAPTFAFFRNGTVEGWSDGTGFIELWDNGFQNIPAFEGEVFAELNSVAPGALSQDICLLAGETIRWSFAHRARPGSGVDPQTVRLEIVPAGGGTPLQTLATQRTRLNQGWRVNSGSAAYSGPTAVRQVRFGTPDPGSVGNFLDALSLDIPAAAEFASADTEDLEAAGGNLPALRVSGRIDQLTTVPVRVVGGTADAQDYTLDPPEITIPPGTYADATFAVPLSVADNGANEADETIVLEFGAPSTNEIAFASRLCDGTAPQVRATYTILNDDAFIEGQKTVEVFDPGGKGLYAVPGNDVLYRIRVANRGTVELDADTLFLRDTLPAEAVFFTGDADGPGPGADSVVFTETGSGLSAALGSEIRFSDAVSAPTRLADCTYSPMGTPDTDPAVRHICVAPRGRFRTGTPDPEFALVFRTRIR